MADDMRMRANTEAEIARIAPMSQGRVGVAAIHLGSGARLGFNDTMEFPMASTIKVPLALTVLDHVDKGRIKLSNMFAVEPREMMPSGPVGDEFFHPGVAFSVHNLLEPMITRSDNTATDVLYRAVGGPQAVAAHLQAMGANGIRVSRTIRDLLIVLYGLPALGEDQSVMGYMRALPPDELATVRARAYAPNPAYSNDPQDQATPSGMLDLLSRVWRADGVSVAARDLLLPIMQRTTTGLRRIRGRLPPGVAVGDKTGGACGTTNDIGFVTLPGDRGTVALAIYVKESPLPNTGREEVIADIARLVYDYYVVAS
jgi:beta-lactamase class A